MLYIILKISIKCINKTTIVCQCFECNRMDKICCVFCHDNMGITMKLYKHAGKIGDFVGGNTSRNT